MIERVLLLVFGFLLGFFIDSAFANDVEIESCKQVAEYAVDSLEECTRILTETISVTEAIVTNTSDAFDQNRRLSAARCR